MEKIKIMNSRPLIFIIGTTCAGKTKLSLEIAKKFSGEIISADSMQIYKKANIMTAKVTDSEQKIAKHHMIDIIDITEKDYFRNIYFFESNKIIKQLQKIDKIPIIVGGTHYYIESLLFDYEIGANEKINLYTADEDSKEKNYNELKKIDPILAEKLHVNDTKRIANYLNNYKNTGIIPSEIFKKNENSELRFDNILLFWPKAKNKKEFEILVRKRTNEMLNKQGIAEIFCIFDELERNKIEIDFTKGIMQAIGYKEFYPFYQEIKKFLKEKNKEFDENLIDIFKENETIAKSLEKCGEDFIKNNISYAKRQIKWIKNRLISNEKIKNRLFLFEYEKAEFFEKMVVQPAFEIIESFEKDKETFCTENKFSVYLAKNYCKSVKKVNLENWKKFHCERCDKTVNGNLEWDFHLKSRKHKNAKKK